MRNLMIAFFILLALFLLTIMGCQTKYVNYESETVKVKYINTTFLSWAVIKDFMARLTDGSTFGQGETFTKPDPNSVEAFTEGAIKGLKGI